MGSRHTILPSHPCEVLQVPFFRQMPSRSLCRNIPLSCEHLLWLVPPSPKLSENSGLLGLFAVLPAKRPIAECGLRVRVPIACDQRPKVYWWPPLRLLSETPIPSIFSIDR